MKEIVDEYGEIIISYTVCALCLVLLAFWGNEMAAFLQKFANAIIGGRSV